MEYSKFDYNPEMAILYAIGIGEEEDPKYLYESNNQFTIIPTFFILSTDRALTYFNTYSKTLAELEVPFDMRKLLLGEHFIEFYHPFSSVRSTIITEKPRLIEVLDKGSGTVVIAETNTYNQDGLLLCRNQVCCMILGSGGWNGPRYSNNSMVENIVKPPERKPDHVEIQQTHVHQAALYRLLGDKNPLHIDPIVSQAAGYPRPILHGLCSLGYAVRHVMKTYPMKGHRVHKVKTRFSHIIYPGETLLTEMWKEGLRVHFQCKVKESGKTIISGAYVDFKEI